MNEWLTEKGQDINKPLSIKTELEMPPDEAVFVKCLPSPHTNLNHLRRNSTNTTPVASATVTTKTSTLVQSMGSAKKRWLRQAMCETDADTSSSMPNGSLSPNFTFPSPSPSPVGKSSSNLQGLLLNIPLDCECVAQAYTLILLYITYTLILLYITYTLILLYITYTLISVEKVLFINVSSYVVILFQTL
jgi:hypothetical protein